MLVDPERLNTETRWLALASRLLAILAMLLVALSIFLFNDITDRVRTFKAGTQEDALWAVYQLERSVRMVNSELTSEAMNSAKETHIDAVRMQYDILWSRISLLEQKAYRDILARDAETIDAIEGISLEVKTAEPFFAALSARDRPDNAELQEMKRLFSALRDRSEQVLMRTNAMVASQRAAKRTELTERSALTIQLFFALVATVVLLVILLYRQLAMTRRATTQLRNMAGKLKTAFTDAEAGNWAKSRFLATVSHEIRTPLTAILGLSDLVLARDLQDDVRTDVEQIRDSGTVLLDILNEVLDYSSLESGKQTFSTVAFNLDELVEKTVRVFAAKAKEKGIDLTVSVPDLPGGTWIESDPTRLRQVLLNFVSNAIKFTENGSVNVSAELTGDGLASKLLALTVTDTGIGISDTGLARLFKPFSQVDSSVTRRFGGTGLGLAIAKGIAERMGGNIGTESTPGAGSKFWVSVPVALTPKPHDTAEDSEKSHYAGLSILVVDDNLTNLRVFKARLESYGCLVSAAGSGHEALHLAAEQTFDLIFMDMQMPEMDGVETAACMRGSEGPNRQTPIVALTANAAPADREACFAAGMNGFETKPLPAGRLVEWLEDNCRHGDEMESVSLPAPCGHGKFTPNASRKAELVSEIGMELYDELWDAFCDEAGKLLGGIHADLAAGRLVETRAKLHTLKGAAANIGIDELAQAADSIRHMGTAEEMRDAFGKLQPQLSCGKAINQSEAA